MIINENSKQRRNTSSKQQQQQQQMPGLSQSPTNNSTPFLKYQSKINGGGGGGTIRNHYTTMIRNNSSPSINIEINDNNNNNCVLDKPPQYRFVVIKTKNEDLNDNVRQHTPVPNSQKLVDNTTSCNTYKNVEQLKQPDTSSHNNDSTSSVVTFYAGGEHKVINRFIVKKVDIEDKLTNKMNQQRQQKQQQQQQQQSMSSHEQKKTTLQTRDESIDIDKSSSQEFECDKQDEKPIDKSPDNRFLKFDKEIGRGAFKTVYKGLDTENGVPVAWCELHKGGFKKQQRLKFKEEAEMLKQLQHPNILRFFDYWEDKKPRKIILVTELMTSGTLKAYIQHFKRQDQAKKFKVIKNFSNQILKGLAYLHGRTPPVIHRDLKCDNVFVAGQCGQVKIGDLGLATLKKHTFAKSVIGTPEFMAPEMYSERYDESIDVYAFGMCVLEMVTGEYPYQECTKPYEIYKRVIVGVKPECYNRVANEDLKELISLCISSNKSNRPTVKQLLSHSIYMENNGLCLEVARDPNTKRILSNATQITLIIKIVNKNKRKNSWLEDVSIEFSFDVDTDDPDEVVKELKNSYEEIGITDDDTRYLVQAIKDKCLIFKVERSDEHDKLNANNMFNRIIEQPESTATSVVSTPTASTVFSQPPTISQQRNNMPSHIPDFDESQNIEQQTTSNIPQFNATDHQTTPSCQQPVQFNVDNLMQNSQSFFTNQLVFQQPKQWLVPSSLMFLPQLNQQTNNQQQLALVPVTNVSILDNDLNKVLAHAKSNENGTTSSNGKVEEKHLKKKTKKSKEIKLKITDFTSNELVHCVLELDANSISFKFGLNTDKPEDVTAKLVTQLPELLKKTNINDVNIALYSDHVLDLINEVTKHINTKVQTSKVYKESDVCFMRSLEEQNKSDLSEQSESEQVDNVSKNHQQTELQIPLAQIHGEQSIVTGQLSSNYATSQLSQQQINLLNEPNLIDLLSTLPVVTKQSLTMSHNSDYQYQQALMTNQIQYQYEQQIQRHQLVSMESTPSIINLEIKQKQQPKDKEFVEQLNQLFKNEFLTDTQHKRLYSEVAAATPTNEQPNFYDFETNDVNSTTNTSYDNSPVSKTTLFDFSRQHIDMMGDKKPNELLIDIEFDNDNTLNSETSKLFINGNLNTPNSKPNTQKSAEPVKNGISISISSENVESKQVNEFNESTQLNNNNLQEYHFEHFLSMASLFFNIEEDEEFKKMQNRHREELDALYRRQQEEIREYFLSKIINANGNLKVDGTNPHRRASVATSRPSTILEDLCLNCLNKQASQQEEQFQKRTRTPSTPSIPSTMLSHISDQLKSENYKHDECTIKTHCDAKIETIKETDDK